MQLVTMYWPPHTKQMKYKTTCTHRQLTCCSLTFVYDPDHKSTRTTKDCLHNNRWPSHLIVPFHGVIFWMKGLSNRDPDALITNWPLCFKSDQLHHHAKVITFPFVSTSEPISVQWQTSTMFRPMLRNTHLLTSRNKDTHENNSMQLSCPPPNSKPLCVPFHLTWRWSKGSAEWRKPLYIYIYTYAHTGSYGRASRALDPLEAM